jgi:hypothetical protein
LLNSDAYIGLLHLLMARGLSSGQTLKYEVGYLASVPIPAIPDPIKNKLAALAEDGYRIGRNLSTSDETSHVYVVPGILQTCGGSLAESLAEWQVHIERANLSLSALQQEINDIAFGLYGIGPEDRRVIEEGLCGQSAVEEAESSEPDYTDEKHQSEVSTDVRRTLVNLTSYTVGCVFGRWDVGFATGEKRPPELPDPFAPLPACSPGMLQGPDGLPLTTSPPGYPLDIAWDGLLVDDADHERDLVRRVRGVLELIWRERAEGIEQEACEILGVKGLRDYFRKPGSGGFWSDHVARYSKSRRKAPIYWLLQSGKKSYALWLYYHRLGKDVLFKALVNYVEPKVRLEGDRLGQLRTQRAAASGKAVKQLDKQIERQEGLLSELRDFEDKLRRAANLRLEPDLNDGVVLTIAPLWELVPWKEAKAYWDELLAGKYEWSSVGKQLRQKGLVR